MKIENRKMEKIKNKNRKWKDKINEGGKRRGYDEKRQSWRIYEKQKKKMEMREIKNK